MVYRLSPPDRRPADIPLREVFFLIGVGEEILWSDASDSPVRLPDSRARWTAIWSHRDRIVEIAHSHPVGPLAFSREDETTMQALASALGRPLTFSVVSPAGMVRTTIAASTLVVGPAVSLVPLEPSWATVLRLTSGIRADASIHP